MRSPQPEQRGRRLDAYVRVSRVARRDGETFISPKMQEERIRAWAQAMGHVISDDGPDNGTWHELDVSGGKMDRPKLNEIMARIDAGESDGIVVFTLDRFGRRPGARARRGAAARPRAAVFPLFVIQPPPRRRPGSRNSCSRCSTANARRPRESVCALRR